MKTPFRLDEHPRRSHPLAPPPDDFFAKLPLRVMQRVQAAPEAAPMASWLAALSAPLRTALASVVLLLAFVGAYWTSTGPMAPATQPTSVSSASVQAAVAEQAVATLPQAEVVQYLLSNADRLTLLDLAETPIADRDLTASFLPGSSAELEAALDEQPTVDVYL